MGIRNRDHERPAPSLLADDPRGERVKFHEGDCSGRNPCCVMCGGVLWTKGRDIYSATTPAFESLCQLQSGFINTRKRIVGAGDEVAVERRDIMAASDSDKAPSTRS